MKKLIIVVGLSGAFSVMAETYQRTPILGLAPQANMYASYEVITNKFEKVVLDCQGFINGMRFYNDKKLIREIRMVDYGTCEYLYDFINQSQKDNKAVCMEIEEESNSLNLSNNEVIDCQ
ncbi:MAG: hypothetical protein Q7U04_12920 [Bacteriovorax sp.]|nr:hypothetical protein [Bacteriovorax sp.]